MSRTPKTGAPASAPAQAAESSAVAVIAAPSLGTFPAALSALIGAVTALASFPSSPVPETLVQNVVKARQAFQAALDAPVETLASVGEAQAAGGYDDAWIREAFEGLEALTKRLDDQVAPEPADLGPIEERLAAIEAAPTDLAPFEARLAALEATLAAANA